MKVVNKIIPYKLFGIIFYYMIYILIFTVYRDILYIRKDFFRLEKWSEFMVKMVLVDLETQNFSVESGIYEVACLAIVNYEIVDSLYLGKEIPNYIGPRKYGYGFYNISRDKEAIEKFQRFINKHPYPLVAHNCRFDRGFLVHYKWIPTSYPFYCSIEALKNSRIYFRSYSLDILVKSLRIATSTTHNAMDDIINLYKVLKKLKPHVWKPVNQ